MPSDAPLKLMVIMSSTRPGRVGLPVAKWFYETALENGSFEVDFCDLLDVNLRSPSSLQQQALCGPLFGEHTERVLARAFGPPRPR